MAKIRHLQKPLDSGFGLFLLIDNRKKYDIMDLAN